MRSISVPPAAGTPLAAARTTQPAAPATESGRTHTHRGSGRNPPEPLVQAARIETTATTTVRILIATTTPALGVGLAAWLTAAQPGWEVAGIADSPRALESLLTDHIDLVVASACIDGLSILAATSRVRAEIPLVFLTRDDDPQMEADLLRAGALGVLPTTVDRQTLIRTATDALARRSTASADAIRFLAEPPTTPLTITVRQRQILEALASAQSTTDIADALVLTPSTIKTHIGRLAARFGLSGRQALTHAAPKILIHCTTAKRAGPEACPIAAPRQNRHSSIA